MLRQVLQWIGPGIPLDSGISLLTLIVLTWTLVWIHRYTRAAQKQVDAALEQVEALQKPFLTVTWEKLTDHEVIVEISMALYENRPLRLGKVPTDGFRIYNIGSGPALNISYRLKSVQNGKILKPAYASSFPHLPCKECLQTDINRNVLFDSIVRSALDESENVEFAIQYESLRGVSYQTTVSIHREGIPEGPEVLGSSNFTWVITRVQMNRIPLVR